MKKKKSTLLRIFKLKPNFCWMDVFKNYSIQIKIGIHNYTVFPHRLVTKWKKMKNL